jgi:hypothetical protein
MLLLDGCHCAANQHDGRDCVKKPEQSDQSGEDLKKPAIGRLSIVESFLDRVIGIL